MDGKQLRNSILQWAIQGKLVPQDPNDEPASVLLERIREEKARLVKEKRIKRDKNESIIYRGDDNSYYEKILATSEVKCIDDEITISIPETWVFARLEDIVQINPKNDCEDSVEAAFIPMEKIDATYLSSFTFALKKWGEIKKGFTHFANGDVAFAKITPCFQNRKSVILKDLPNGVGAGTTELRVLRRYGNTIILEYLLFFLESPYFVDEATFKGTANQQRIITGYLEKKLFPLPPLAEQKRIVEMILQLFPVVESYEKSQNKLNLLNNNIKPFLKKSILQEAIQGRLVDQNKTDEPASVLLEKIRAEKKRLINEGKLKKSALEDSVIFKGDDNKYWEKRDNENVCIDDDLPYTIPNNWVWCRMQDVISFINGRAYKKEELLSSGKYKVLRVGNFFTNDTWYYSNLELPEDKYCYHGDLLYAWSASFGPQIWNGDKTIFHYHIWNVKYNTSILLRDYLYYFLLADKAVIKKSTTGSTMIHVSMENMKLRFIPIPPIKEQQRIVDAIVTAWQVL